MLERAHTWLVVGATLCGVAYGCDGAAPMGNPGVLHEQVPNLKPNEAELALAARGELPAIEHNGTLYSEPEGGPLRDDEVAMSAAHDDTGSGADPAMDAATNTNSSQPNTTQPPLDTPGQRSTVYYPDRQTSLNGTLDYFEVFKPAISPFKRVTALDRVVLGSDGRTPGLTTTVGTRTHVAIEPRDAPAPDARARDLFWGSVVLDFSAGDTVPLPSVSPESRLFNMTSEPAIGLRIEKDAADNFVVTRTQRNTPNQARLTFLTDAPHSYFASAIPDAALDVLASEVPPLEASIQRRALRFASELQVTRATRLPDALAKLTQHFRSFVESEQPPTDTGDVYLDLARGKKGICRHRAYAFVVTAQALGIPTRFVQNEAHSWVEVKLPEVGWMRIDLGGAADGLRAQNSDAQQAYQPPNADTLPRPQEYRDAYAQQQQQQQQQDDQGQAQRDEAQRLDPNQMQRAEGQWVSPDHDNPATRASERTGVGLSERAATSADDTQGKLGLLIELDRTPGDIYRGGMLQVSGRVIDQGRDPVAAMRIEIALKQPLDERSLLLGVTVSDEQGYFSGSYGVPTTLDVGQYKLRVTTPGNARYLPAVAQ